MSGGSTLIVAAIVIGVALYLSRPVTNINNSTQISLSQSQTQTAPSSGSSGNPLAALAAFF